MKHALGTGAAAALLALGTIGAARPAADDTYALRPIYRAGEAHHYRTVVDVETKTPLTTARTEFVLTTTEIVRDLKPDGTMVTETKLDGGSIKLAGQEVDLPGVGETYRVTVDKNGAVAGTEQYDAKGKVLDPKALRDPHEQHAPFQLLDMTRIIVRPDHPLRIGDKYQYQFTAGPDGKQKLVGVLTVMGQEKAPIGSGQALRLRNAADLTTVIGAEQKLHIDAMMVVDSASFQTLSTQGAVSNDKVGPNGDSTMNIAFNRLRLATAP